MFSWGRMPFVRFLVPLISGILIQAFLGIGLLPFLLLSLVGLLGLYIVERVGDYEQAFRLRHLHAPFIILIMVGIGGMTADIGHRTEERSSFSEQEKAEWLRGRLVESITAKKKSYRTVIDVEAVKTDIGWERATGKLLIYLAKDSVASGLEPGDAILLQNKSRKVAGPANPGEFDYRRFLAIQNIHYQQYIRAGHWEKVDSRWTLKRQAERARQYFIGRLHIAGLQGDELAIATALLLGQKDRLSTELMHAYAGAGAMHVLAVSGLHVGILFTMLGWFLMRLERLENGVVLKAILMILALWAYAFITGLSPSVVRASTMFTAVLIGKALKRNSDVYNNIASSAFILLCIEPYYIFQVGFQLSYIAVVGIIFLQPRIKELYYAPNRVIRWIWEISCVSIAAQIATFPLSLLYFHQFPVYFLLSNLIVIPAAAFILYVGLVYLAVSWIPFIGEWLGLLLRYIIKAMNFGVRSIEGIPYSVIGGIDITKLQAFIIYAIVLCSILYFSLSKKRALLYAMTLTIVFLALQIHEQFDFKDHDYLVVYDVRKRSAVNLLSDDLNLLLCDSVLAADEGAQDYQLSGNWYRHGAPVPSFDVDSTGRMGVSKITEGLLAFKDHRLALVDSKDDLPSLTSPLDIDYLILSYYRGMRMDEISRSYAASTIIFDSTIGRPKAEKLSAHVPDSVRLHIVAVDGYFEERLD